MNKLFEITIAQMKPSDVDEVINIEALSHGEHHWSGESFYNELKNKLAHYFCAKDENGRVLGYIGYWVIFEEAHITTLSIHPDYRKNQIAQALLIRAIEHCYQEKVKFITLEVRQSNVCAIALYEKFGFVSIGARKNYYQDNNEDALIMFTENIWYSKFKEIYANIKTGITKIKVIYD